MGEEKEHMIYSETRTDYDRVSSTITFTWVCPVNGCSELNHLSYDMHELHNGIDECRKCEYAVRVRLAWE